MSTTINGTSGVTFPDGTNQTTSPFAGGLGFRNRIINGDFRIDQRNAGASVTVSASTTTYLLDRWNLRYTTGSGLAVAKSSTAPTGFNNSFLVTVGTGTSAAASANNRLIQFIEGFNTADLGFGASGASAVTLSFWVRSSITGTYSVVLQNSAGDRSYIATYTVSATNTWEQKSVTISGDTAGTWIGATNGVGLTVMFDLGSGTDYDGASGSWLASGARRTSGSVRLVETSGATFYITGVQLEKGSTATSFDYRPYGTELALCQRYYYLLASGANQSFANGSTISSSQVRCHISFPVTMRTAASLVQNTGTSYYLWDALAGTTISSFTTAYAGPTGILMYNGGVSVTAGQGGTWFTTNAASYLAFNAEL